MLVVDQYDITAAWIEGTAELIAVGGDAFSSIVRVERFAEPTDRACEVRRILDSFLVDKNRMDSQAVANTIFPITMAQRSPAELHDIYESQIWPVIKRVNSNRRGTYFRRLIRFEASGTSQRPLVDMIAKMRTQLERDNPIRCAYELAVYSPQADGNVLMGFPCLSHLSFKLDTGSKQVHVAALYRNQTYVERLYGNLLGLGRLVDYVAKRVGLEPGEIVCHAGHAELGKGISTGAAEGLIRSCRTAT